MRVISKELGVTCGVQCEWTGTTLGRVDFYIANARWAVELLREGDKASIVEHTGRFTSTRGQYWRLKMGRLGSGLLWIAGRAFQKILVGIIFSLGGS
jgi:hypothetical protein